MKILQVVNLGYPAGGAEMSVRFLKEELTTRGHEVKVLSSDIQGDNMFSDYQFKAIPSNSKFKVFHHMFYFRSYKMILNIIKTFKPDVIHFHTVGTSTPSIFFAGKKIPSVMTVHGPEEFTLKLLPWFLPAHDYKGELFNLDNLTFTGKLHYWYYKFIQRPIYLIGLERIKFFITPSKYLATVIDNDVDKNKIIQIYNGIKLPDVKQLPSNLNILYVGRLEKVKGVDYLIKACVEVFSKFPNAKLRIVGDGQDRSQLEHLVIELGISNYVEFTGWLKSPSDILKEYENALVLCIPSIWPENLPTVCIEALAVGRPIIGTNTGGIPELIENNKNGYIVPIKDSSALREAIIKLFNNNQNTLNQMAKSSEEKSQSFNIINFINQIENIYEKISK